MNKQEILKFVDHTILSPTATEVEVFKVCKEAAENKTASVCIMPCYVKDVKKQFKNLNICTVVGFPLGYSTLEAKVFETKQAIKNGASEVDMVVNQNYIKDKKFDLVLKEIKALKKVCKNKILKVIIETSNLEKPEKIELCKIVSNANADYIKTSTGFASGGADVLDIKLFKKHLNANVKIKASGGISTLKDAEKFIAAGASRIGASKLVKAKN